MKVNSKYSIGKGKRNAETKTTSVPGPGEYDGNQALINKEQLP